MRVAAGAILAVLLAAGCSPNGSAPAAPAPSGPGTPAATTTPAATSTPSLQASASASPATTPTSWNADGPSFGVDRARWPRTAKQARAVLKAMPATLAGARREVYGGPAEEDDGADAGIVYGESVSLHVSQEYVTTDTADGEPELLHANNLLAAGFNLGYICEKGGYRGTAPQHADFPGPAVTEKPLKEDVWFSCRIAAAEGDEDFTGQALGWTSGKTAWVLIGQDEKVVREFVTALHAAAS